MKNRVWKIPVTFEDHVADLEAGRSLQVDNVLDDPALAARLWRWLSARPRDETALANVARLVRAFNERASVECSAEFWKLRQMGAQT